MVTQVTEKRHFMLINRSSIKMTSSRGNRRRPSIPLWPLLANPINGHNTVADKFSCSRDGRLLITIIITIFQGTSCTITAPAAALAREQRRCVVRNGALHFFNLMAEGRFCCLSCNWKFYFDNLIIGHGRFTLLLGRNRRRRTPGEQICAFIGFCCA